MKDQIAIWGAGVRGREAYNELKKKFHIVGFLDSDIRKKDMGKECWDRRYVSKIR